MDKRELNELEIEAVVHRVRALESKIKILKSERRSIVHAYENKLPKLDIELQRTNNELAAYLELIPECPRGPI